MKRWVRLTAAGAVLLVGILVTAILVTERGDANKVRTTTPTAGTPRQASPAAASASPSPSPAPSPISHPQLMLPNLRSQPAFDLRIEDAGGGRRLRFSAGLANDGPGPLLVRRTGRGSCPSDQFATVQVIFEDRNDDDLFQRGTDGFGTSLSSGCMLDHPTHDHWHFDAMAAYTLHRPGAATPLVSRDKISFCLRDNRRIPGVPTEVKKEYYGECARDTPQGISPGWVDVYSFELDGQWLEVPDEVDDEVVCLSLEADPQHLLAETDGFDNASSVAIRIDGSEVEPADAVACEPLPN
jgi:hypothetical protein